MSGPQLGHAQLPEPRSVSPGWERRSLLLVACTKQRRLLGDWAGGWGVVIMSGVVQSRQDCRWLGNLIERLGSGSARLGWLGEPFVGSLRLEWLGAGSIARK